MRRRSVVTLGASLAAILAFVWALVMREDNPKQANEFFQSAGGAILCFLLVYFFFLDTDD